MRLIHTFTYHQAAGKTKDDGEECEKELCAVKLKQWQKQLCRHCEYGVKQVDGQRVSPYIQRHRLRFALHIFRQLEDE